MSNWDRKAAYSLAGAIDHHMTTVVQNVAQKQALSAIAVEANIASKTIETSDLQLQVLRKSLCSVCIGERLYECDVAEQGASNCAFMRRNTDLTSGDCFLTRQQLMQAMQPLCAF